MPRVYFRKHGSKVGAGGGGEEGGEGVVVSRGVSLPGRARGINRGIIPLGAEGVPLSLSNDSLALCTREHKHVACPLFIRIVLTPVRTITPPPSLPLSRSRST